MPSRLLSVRLPFLVGLITLLAFWATPGRGAEGVHPSLWLIGDSTVKNGAKDLRGWGEEIGSLFDPAKITVQNRALGGRSSRTYRDEGHWAKALAEIKPGDFVLVQFGHNDAGKVAGEFAPGRPARASLKGNGEETEEAQVGTTEARETVHTYGWYLRSFIKEAKAKGAAPVVLSPVPRNDWKDGKVLRATGNFGKWASEAALAEGVPFVDLNEIVARHYEELGEEKVKAFFPHEHTHTSAEGALLNARCVVEGIQNLQTLPLRGFLAPSAATTASVKTLTPTR